MSGAAPLFHAVTSEIIADADSGRHRSYERWRNRCDDDCAKVVSDLIAVSSLDLLRATMTTCAPFEANDWATQSPW